MDRLKFSWDARKNTSNIKKHGISFDEAKSVFLDDFARLISDPDHSDDEERFILLGYSHKTRLLVVCHYYIESDDTIRIISVRKAEKSERKIYESFRYEK